MYDIGYLKDRGNVIKQFEKDDNRPKSIRLYKSIAGKTFREQLHCRKIIRVIPLVIIKTITNPFYKSSGIENKIKR